MNRRNLLAQVGGVVGIGTLGGCLDRYRDLPGQENGTAGRERAGRTGRPELVGTDFTLLDSGCGTTTNEATIGVDLANESVVVDGVVPGSNTCYVAELAGAKYDPDGAFEVRVASKQREGADVCGQCIVEIDYEATLRFDGGLPETITVVHEAMGETTTVVKTTLDFDG